MPSLQGRVLRISSDILACERWLFIVAPCLFVVQRAAGSFNRMN